MRTENGLLISLLNAVTQPPKPVTAIQIVLPHADKESADDKMVVADVKARDQGNRQFHLEMQWQVPWFFTKRVLFYWGEFHPQQLRGRELRHGAAHDLHLFHLTRRSSPTWTTIIWSSACAKRSTACCSATTWRST